MCRIEKAIVVLLSMTMMCSIFTLQTAAFNKQDEAASVQENTVQERKIVNFNNDWSYKKGDVKGAENADFDSREWLYVNLPHATDQYTSEQKEAYLGISTYRKVFDVDSAWQGQKLLLTFEAAMQSADVWVNGEKVMHHEGGYTPFVIDLTDHVTYGEKNSITVKIDSRPNVNFAPGKTKPDFEYWGGIYGNSYITLTNRIHISDVLEANVEAGGGIFITAPSVTEGKASLQVKTHVMNESETTVEAQVHQEVYDKNNVLVTSHDMTHQVDADSAYSFVQDMEVENPDLWSVTTPDLYLVKTTVHVDGQVYDEVSTKYGIRKVKWQRDGLYVNDERMDVSGTNLHSETFMLGNAVPTNAIHEEVKRVKENGFDAIRMSHYPHVQAFYDACDKYGIMVIECVAGWQNYNNSTAFKNSTYEQMRTMVRTHRNNASVVAWEASLNESNYTKEWALEMNRITKAEYPTNGDAYAYTAGCVWWNAWDIGLGTPQADLFGTGGQGVNGGANQNKPIIIAEYGDWNYGGSSSTTRVTREPVNRWGMAGGDTGMLIQANNLQEAVNVNRLKGKDWLGLSAQWHYSDYAGFDYDMLSNSGVVDTYRLPKFSAYFYRSQRDASVDMSAYDIETGPMVYIANTWTKDSPTEVRIFSNCDTVELFLNGKRIAEKGHDETIWGPHGDGNHRDYPVAGAGKEISAEGLKNAPITFQLDGFEEGELKAVGKINGEEETVYIRNTPKAAQSVDLRKENDVPLRLDGSDAKLVWIDIIDENGTILPTATNAVDLQVEGPGIVIGEKTLNVRGGQLGVWIRGKRGEGNVTLTAKAANLQTKTITIETEHIDDLPQVPVGGDADETEFVEEETPVNIFLGKSAIAKTEQVTQKAVYANDGDDNTKWCETGTGAPEWNNALPQWWQVDLGDVYKLSEIDMSMETNGAIYQYTISLSNDPNVWEEDQIIVDRRNNTTDANNNHKISGNGRYVRIEITGTPNQNGKPEWAVLREVSGIGTSANIALNKPTSASSENIAGSKIEFAKWANDGDTSTKWCAKGGTGTSGHWWQVDLKDTFKLSDVNIMFELNNAGYKFDLQGSLDGVNYTSIKDFRKESGTGQNVHVETDGVVRYLRIYDISTKNMTNQWPCIIEVSAHGDPLDYTLQSVSREKPANASSSGYDTLPSYGNNGVPNYYWYPETFSDEWWVVDTEGFYDLNNIQFTWNENQNHKYTIELSNDGHTWTRVVDKSEYMEEQMRTFDAVKGTARFIRVSMPGVRNVKQGFGLFDAYAPKAEKRTVEEVMRPMAIKADLHTVFDELSLPAEIAVTLKGDISATLPVTWSKESYDPNVAGEQTIQGTLTVLDGAELQDTSIAITVLLSDEEEPSMIRNILNNAIKKCESANTDHLAPSVAAMIRARLAEAKMVYYDSKATDEACFHAWLYLADAMHYLDFAANKTELGKLITACEAIDMDEYTEGVEAFKKALADAKKVYADDGVLQASIQKAYDELESARNSLSKVNADKALLQRLYTSIQEVVGDGNLYNQTDEAWRIFSEAMSSADAVLNNKEASQEQVNAAITVLANAYTDIRLLPNEALLKDLQSFVVMVDASDLTRFNAEQTAFITDTKNKALDLLANPESITPSDAEQIKKEMDEVKRLLESEDVDAPVTDVAQPNDVNKRSDVANTNGTVKPGTTKTGDATNTFALSMLLLGSAAILVMRKRKD